MSKLASININLSKIDKNRLFQGKQGIYLNATISINEQPDEYGNHISVWESQSKEEQQAKANRNFLGSGKVFWSANEPSAPQAETPAQATPVGLDEDELPF